MGILCLVQQVADRICEFLLRLSFGGAAGPISDVLHLTLNPIFPPYPMFTAPRAFQVANF